MDIWIQRRLYESIPNTQYPISAPPTIPPVIMTFGNASPSRLVQRVHISPDALARSPGNVAEHFDAVSDALAATLTLLRPLPGGLIDRWLAKPGGHIIIDARKHEFVAGESLFRGRALPNVAWVRLALLVEDPISYLTPVGWLIARILDWGQPNARADQRWRDFERGVQSGFAAGYGRSDAARADVNAYLAEGIAWHLADPRGLNMENPRLHKLLRATVFSEAFYKM